MSTRTDMTYSRQGGRIVDGAPVEFESFRLCEVCDGPLTAGQRRHHHLCDPDSIVGHMCTCRTGCTQTAVGDQGVCDPDCEVCTTMAGKIHADVEVWKRSKK